MSELRDRIAEALLAEFHHEYVAYHVDAVIDCFLPVVQEALDDKDAAIEALRERFTLSGWQDVTKSLELAQTDLARTESALTAAVAAVEKVRNLHNVVHGNGWTWCAEDQTSWPCATVRALPAVDPAGGGEQ